MDDTWYVAGMIGTGSNDIVVDGAFIPEERTVSIVEMVEGRAPGSRLHAVAALPHADAPDPRARGVDADRRPGCARCCAASRSG